MTASARKADQAASSASPAPRHSAQSLTEACQTLFGDFPEDVVSPIRWSADALLQVEAICKAIAAEAHTPRPNLTHIRHLAEAGSYLAQDIANLADCRHEDFLIRLRQAGVKVIA